MQEKSILFFQPAKPTKSHATIIAGAPKTEPSIAMGVAFQWVWLPALLSILRGIPAADTKFG
jgi:hypothetical protein